MTKLKTTLCLLLLVPALAKAEQPAGAPAAPPEDEINVVGLSSGKAVVQMNGNPKPRVLRDGDTLPSGIKLIKATPESALFEVNGKRRSLGLGSNQVSNARSAFNASSSVTLVADSRGQFMTTGSINGAVIQRRVDTGATFVALGVEDARRMGINYLKGERVMSRTANGLARVYKVKLDSVKVGDISLNNVDATVHEAEFPLELLGMSFLNRVEMRREGTDLTLTKRY
jgi:aspartyl protease family protein